MRIWRTLAIICLLGPGIIWSLSSRTNRVTESRPVWLFYDTLNTDARLVSAAVVRAGGRVRYRSRWLNAVSAELPAGSARRLSHIVHVQPVNRLYASVGRTTASHHTSPFRLVPESAPLILVHQALDSAAYGNNYGALRELGVPQAHQLGFTGRGVRIAILDTGFEPDHEVFEAARLTGNIVAQRDFIHEDGNVATQPGDPPAPRDQEKHGTWVWSILGGNKRGQVVGPAFNGMFILAKVDVEQTTDDFAADEDRWVEAAEWAQSLGARVINSSLAYKNFLEPGRRDYTPDDMNGNVAVSSRFARSLARNGVLLVNAMGNTTGPGPATAQSVFAPADADSIIAVGAIDNLGQVWPSSARGPTADGRTKPELVARGVSVTAANSTNNSYEPVAAGTSLATPFVAGAAALFMEAWPNATPMYARAALLLSGNNPFADQLRGNGLPNVAQAIMLPEGLTPSGVEDVDLVTNTLTTLRPIFRWSGVVHPSIQPRYRLELGSDVQFNTIIYSDTVTGARQLALKQPLRPRLAVWWRVTAESQVGQVRRSTVTVGPISMPGWVSLLVLNEPRQQHVNTTRPQFSWQPLTAPPPVGPLTYDLQVLNGVNGNVVQTMPNLTSASITLVNPLTPNLSYRWRIITRTQVAGLADTVVSRGTFVVNSSSQPPTTALYPSFPNPFPRVGESVTHFWFDLEQQADVELTIHDLRGRLVRRLIPGAPGCPPMASGQYGRGVVESTDPCVQLAWDGKDQDGRTVARGVYVARLRANRMISTQRILFLGNQ